MSALRIVRPGLFTTVQDLGRFGFQHVGVPVSGAMDGVSHRLANALAGNSAAEASLECTLVGPELEAQGAVRMALAGAECDLTVDSRRHRSPCVVDLSSGMRVQIGHTTRGARMYVAVRGGFDTPRVLGSRATDVRSGLGAFGGRRLAAGDELPVGIAPIAGEESTATSRVRMSWLPVQGAETPLRVIPGPHADAGFGPLTSSSFAVSSRCDRVGYRFEERLASRGAGDLVSMPVTFGTVQLTPSGELVLLMADRQTAGGYAQVATVIAADHAVAGQLAPGCRVRFVECTLDEAVRALRESEPFLAPARRADA
jgi:biotin-dependent carboxylase-like uncharacterized protein